MPKPQRGFSLIEGVVLISLLGIAGAFALPRVTRIANQARASEVIALSGSLRNAAALAHAQYLASGARESSTLLAGKTVSLKYGYPDARRAGIGNALANWDGFTTDAGSDAVIFSKTDAPQGALCSVTYRDAVDAATAAVITDVNTIGC
jgi:MSHA pilin protein MshA